MSSSFVMPAANELFSCLSLHGSEMSARLALVVHPRALAQPSPISSNDLIIAGEPSAFDKKLDMYYIPEIAPNAVTLHVTAPACDVARFDAQTFCARSLSSL